MPDPADLTPVPLSESRILLIRGENVLLDSDLSWLYGVPTTAFHQAVKPNRQHFPDDILFPLTPEEGRAQIFKVTNWDLKTGAPKVRALCVHRAGNCDVVFRPLQ